MIPRKAIKSFMVRPRADLRLYKRLTPNRLHAKVRALPVKPPVWNKLLPDQRLLFIAGVKYQRLGIWADTGIGKTLLAMALARYFRKAGTARRFLVLVPGNINLAEWESERELHCPTTSMTVLFGHMEARWQILQTDTALLTVTTYAALVRLVSRKVARTKGKRAGETVLELDRQRVKFLARTFDGLIMDESSADQAVQHRNLAWRVCRQISKTAKCVFALSGTPFGRDPTPLWAQMYLVDKGESLGTTLGLFRAAFFTTKENYWGGEEHTFRTSMAPALHRLLAHRSITIEADEATLPPVVEQQRNIKLPHEAQDYCIMAREAILQAHGNYQETKNAFLRMRQISSRFLGYTDDDTGKRAKFAFEQNPKLESLLSKLESVVGKYKVVVFHEFIYSGDRICQELKRLKIGHARISAGTKQRIAEERRRFVQDDDCRVMVISNKMAQGPNLQVAKYVEFYESPVDPKTRKQARRRVERQHSQHDRVFLTDYVVAGTYDKRILEFHAQGRDLFDAIIRGEVKDV